MLVWLLIFTIDFYTFLRTVLVYSSTCKAANKVSQIFQLNDVFLVTRSLVFCSFTIPSTLIFQTKRIDYLISPMHPKRCDAVLTDFLITFRFAWLQSQRRLMFLNWR